MAMTLTEMAKEAKKLGITYGELENLIKNDKLDEFKRKKAYEEYRRESEDIKVEKSWIGNAHGRQGNRS